MNNKKPRGYKPINYKNTPNNQGCKSCVEFETCPFAQIGFVCDMWDIRG